MNPNPLPGLRYPRLHELRDWLGAWCAATGTAVYLRSSELPSGSGEGRVRYFSPSLTLLCRAHDFATIFVYQLPSLLCFQLARVAEDYLLYRFYTGLPLHVTGYLRGPFAHETALPPQESFLEDEDEALACGFGVPRLHSSRAAPLCAKNKVK